MSLRHSIPLLIASSLVAVCASQRNESQAKAPLPNPDRPVAVFVIHLDGEKLVLTPPDSGVTFDIDGGGTPARIGWTRPGSGDGFLFLDVNGNGVVDNGQELLGNGWRRPDGTRVVSGDDALWVIQGVLVRVPGPVSSDKARIGPEDEAFSRIRFWRDIDHNGESDSKELQTMEQAGIRMISTAFISVGRKPDDVGNLWLLEGWFVANHQESTERRQMVEVEFARAK